ncbi:DUF2922 domain-containing protein [Ectobacillus polymachus]|uniref:DUF2922 domain-containing protein n=1 Tax=Ectobacillus polymachus TaxID=1508806 RepID=UPI003A8A8DF4
MIVLELQFLKEDGKVITFTVDQPTTPVDKAAVNSVMDTILTSDVFRHLGTNARKKGARVIERTINDVNILV